MFQSTDIRFHIKQVLFALLKQEPSPTEEEWHILSKLEGSSPTEFWNVLQSSAAWFQLLDSLGVIASWLANNDAQRVDRTITLLSSLQGQYADRVAELVEPYVGASLEWRRRLIWLMQWGELGAGRRFFELFIRLIDEGLLDEARGPVAVNSDFWMLIHNLPGQHPDWACEVVGHYMQRHLFLSLADDEPNPFEHYITDSQLDDKIFIESAQAAPMAFYEQVFPFMIRVIELNKYEDDAEPVQDRVWFYRTVGRSYNIEGALLRAMEIALSELATHQADEFRTIARQLKSSPYETVQFLLVRAYTANGKDFADEAVEYLMDNPKRLRTGYSDNPYWAMRELLDAISPHCSDDRLARLEEIILHYYNDYEKTAGGRQQRGLAQLTLLQGIESSRLSPRGFKRLQEWQRKFGSNPIEKSQGIQSYSVGSPIPDSAAPKMTDEHWLKALSRYNEDDERTWRYDKPVGGPHQLSAQLQQETQNEPVRFARLLLTFPDTIHPYYFEAVLRGLEESQIDLYIILEVCRRCHALPQSPCGRSITAPIAARADETLPDELLDIVIWYATEDPDPEEEVWRKQASGGAIYYGGSIEGAAINSVRGRVADDMARLIFSKGECLAHFLPALERMVKDPSIAVRSCVAHALIAVLKYNRQRAVDLFIDLCNTEDILLGDRHIKDFL